MKLSKLQCPDYTQARSVGVVGSQRKQDRGSANETPLAEDVNEYRIILLGCAYQENACFECPVSDGEGLGHNACFNLAGMSESTHQARERSFGRLDTPVRRQRCLPTYAFEVVQYLAPRL